jgi:hypothetical protein
LREDDVEQVFHIDRTGDTAKPICRQAKIVGPKLQASAIFIQGGLQMALRLTQEFHVPQAGRKDIACRSSSFCRLVSEHAEELGNPLAGNGGHSERFRRERGGPSDRCRCG